MKLTKEEYIKWCDMIIDQAWDDLNEWEQGFVESILSQLGSKGYLTILQEDKLEKIYAKHTR